MVTVMNSAPERRLVTNRADSSSTCGWRLSTYLKYQTALIFGVVLFTIGSYSNYREAFTYELVEARVVSVEKDGVDYTVHVEFRHEDGSPGTAETTIYEGGRADSTVGTRKLVAIDPATGAVKNVLHSDNRRGAMGTFVATVVLTVPMWVLAVAFPFLYRHDPLALGRQKIQGIKGD